MRRAVVLLAVAACHYEPPAPTAHVRLGPGAGEFLTPLASPPTTCISEDAKCDANLVAGVRTQARMELELAGMSLIDAERINAEQRQRDRVTVEGESTRSIRGAAPTTVASSEWETETTTGRTWSDLSASELQAFLGASGFKGIVFSHIEVGEPRGLGGYLRLVTVSLEIWRVEDFTLARSSRCSVDTGDAYSFSVGFEKATRCALEALSLW